MTQCSGKKKKKLYKMLTELTNLQQDSVTPKSQGPGKPNNEIRYDLDKKD